MHSTHRKPQPMGVRFRAGPPAKAGGGYDRTSGMASSKCLSHDTVQQNDGTAHNLTGPAQLVCVVSTFCNLQVGGWAVHTTIPVHSLNLFIHPSIHPSIRPSIHSSNTMSLVGTEDTAENKTNKNPCPGQVTGQRVLWGKTRQGTEEVDSSSSLFC
jgi:hypothetical protein